MKFKVVERRREEEEVKQATLVDLKTRLWFVSVEPSWIFQMMDFHKTSSCS